MLSKGFHAIVVVVVDVVQCQCEWIFAYLLFVFTWSLASSWFASYLRWSRKRIAQNKFKKLKQQDFSLSLFSSKVNLITEQCYSFQQSLTHMAVPATTGDEQEKKIKIGKWETTTTTSSLRIRGKCIKFNFVYFIFVLCDLIQRRCYHQHLRAIPIAAQPNVSRIYKYIESVPMSQWSELETNQTILCFLIGASHSYRTICEETVGDFTPCDMPILPQHVDISPIRHHSAEAQC